jgi:choline dehydrogenase-like flavoprotein
MLLDFNEAWPRTVEARYDVCICGTGPAGITTARKLAALGKKVLLLEGGGLSYSEESQDHYQGRDVGQKNWGVVFGRSRYFGGDSNLWTGLCNVFDSTAFEVHEYLGLPGWPISHEQVLRGLDEAKEILDIPGADFSVSKQPGFESPWFDHMSLAMSPPTRFSKKYGGEILQSQKIDAFYNANLVDLKLSEDLARVKHLLVRNYNGKTTEVSATQYVLAMGSIENARTLLNATNQVPAGIGNHSGMVGRCFMESLGLQLGRFLVTDPNFWRVGNVSLVPTKALMQRHDIGEGYFIYKPNSSTSPYHGRLGVLKDFLRETGCLSPAVRKLADQIVDFNCPGDGLIIGLIGQEPNPDSRVTLTDDVDTFGLRRFQLNWQLSERDFKTIRILAIESAKEMARLNVARVQLPPYILDPNIEITDIGVAAHEMGTTRMSSDPHYGVVDQNCQVHGVRNLYIIGSSVFPTCGGRNPTLTIVLLALRLADFLSKPH